MTTAPFYLRLKFRFSVQLLSSMQENYFGGGKPATPVIKIAFVGLLAFLVIESNVMSADCGERETKVFKIDGRKLHYHDEGSGRPVLVLHGADRHVPGNWNKSMTALVKAGYRVVFPHRAGRGRSDPHPVFLSLARDSRDMWALVDHLALRRVVLVGHSAGAAVARDMLLKRPDRVACVVSEDSSSFGKLGSAIERAHRPVRRRRPCIL
jgi:alpha-beta hydrolase superfamily lysophospholipase